MKNQVVLSYYGNAKKFKEAGFVPVSISTSSPFPVAGRITSIAPDRWMLGLDKKEYEKKYFHKLDTMGLKLINIEIQNQIVLHGKIALCCYESLKKENDWCHREMFKKWYFSKTGINLQEYTP